MKNSPKKIRFNLRIIISFMFAILLWVYVIGEQDPKLNQKYNNIPITFLNNNMINEKGLILEDIEYTVDITVYGRTSSLYKLKSKNIIASIDLSSIKEKGSYDLPVNISGISNEIEVINLNPPQIIIDVDEFTNEERDIEVSVIGNPEKGLATMNYNINPRTVTVSGPQEILNTVKKIEGEVDVSGAKEDILKTTRLYAYDNEGNQIKQVTIQPYQVDITIPIGKTKTVKISPQIIGKVDGKYVITNIRTNPENILVGAKSSKLEGVNTISTEEIDISNLIQSTEKKVKLILPEGVEVINNKDTVVIEFTIEEIVQKEFAIKGIEYINDPENAIINQDVFNRDVKVILSGKQSDINKITPEDIRLYVDLTGIKEGKDVFSILFEEIKDISTISIIPETIKITLEEDT